jgi:hypothetical protein
MQAQEGLRHLAAGGIAAAKKKNFGFFHIISCSDDLNFSINDYF